MQVRKKQQNPKKKQAQTLVILLKFRILSFGIKKIITLLL